MKLGEFHRTQNQSFLSCHGASELFEAGILEKIIKERTGHRSLEALHVYEHTSTEQQLAVSAVLSAEKKTIFEEACTLNSAVIIRSTQLQSISKIVDLIMLTTTAHLL